MATFNSVLAAKNVSAQTSLQAGIVNGDDLSGVVLYLRDSYTLTGSEAANDLIYLPELPPGSTIVPQLCSVTSADPGTTLTLDVGDSGDSDRYAAGIVLSAGGRIEFTSGTLPAAVGTPYRLTAPTQPIVKIASANTLTANVKLNFVIGYVAKA